jgi:hypothetical protein
VAGSLTKGTMKTKKKPFSKRSYFPPIPFNRPEHRIDHRIRREIFLFIDHAVCIVWWTSTDAGSGYAWCRRAIMNTAAILNDHFIASYGMSVRLVKDP